MWLLPCLLLRLLRLLLRCLSSLCMSSILSSELGQECSDSSPVRGGCPMLWMWRTVVVAVVVAGAALLLLGSVVGSPLLLLVYPDPCGSCCAGARWRVSELELARSSVRVSDGKVKVYPPKLRRACRLYTFSAHNWFSQRRRTWSPFWRSSAPLERTTGASCTLISLSLSLLCSGARRMGRPHPPLRAASLSFFRQTYDVEGSSPYIARVSAPDCCGAKMLHTPPLTDAAFFASFSPRNWNPFKSKQVI